jgi:hypothetical protein
VTLTHAGPGWFFNGPILGTSHSLFVDVTGPTQYGGFVGLQAPVPEPESYAMLLAGLGALGFMGRRRKAKQA